MFMEFILGRARESVKEGGRAGTGLANKYPFVWRLS
jgi:hypothetical protein